MLRSTLTLVTLAVAATQTLAVPCVAMDAEFNLLAFGFDGKDYNAGQQSSWAEAKGAVDISTTGRPPFDGASQCFLSQFSNAVYVLNGDASDSSALYIYDASGKKWSKQATTSGAFDPTSYTAILDRDTNVFYALSKGSMFSLNLKEQKAATDSAIEWNEVGTTPYPSTYEPTMALAQNHVHFMGLPDVNGASIFVIHFSYFQPEPQSYPLVGDGSFPSAHGKTASLFQEAVQEEFAYIPDGGSNTYVVNVGTNTTQALPAPASSDPKASYFASSTAIVQLSSAGGVSYIPYTKGDVSANAAAKWSAVANLAAVASSSSSSGSASGSAGGRPSASSTGTPAGLAAPSGTGNASQAGNGVQPRSSAANVLMVVAGLSGFAALFL